jgi:NAD(P)-dependent dehydrogenase (short-subunit alcohol dehydrogenase family)/acyl carrier protein
VKRAGAEIYATANPLKWDFLREQGITHIMNSRTLDFHMDILNTTSGQGVDIVLNSLSGDFISASLASLASHGRFIEIGKRAVWSQSQVNAIRSDIDYTVYDLISHMLKSPSEVGETLRMLIEWIASGEILPPPITPFPIQASKEAFRYMQQAKHTGKIVITQNEFIPKPVSERRHQKLDGAYLVTGGAGALGIQLVSWLVFRGAKYIFLTGRHKPDAHTMDIINIIRGSGAQITFIEADVSDYTMMSTALNQIKEKNIPLRGIFHTAGILRDSVISTLTREQLEQVMSVKVRGAWNLHQLTLDNQLDFFVMFSSVASVFGSPGQANYAAANAFLDSLAQYRNTLGKAALSINWGAWSGGGMATRTGTEYALEEKGIEPIPPIEGMEVFQDLALGDYTQAIVFPIDWERAAQSQAAPPPLFSEFLTRRMPNNTWHTTLNEILNAPPGMQLAKLSSHVREIVSYVLRIPSSAHIDDRDSFVDLGMDSLMTVELRNMIQSSLNCTLPATLFVNYPTIETLIRYLAEKINIAEKVTVYEEQTIIPEVSEYDLDSLTEDELEQRLDEKLNQLEVYTHDEI